MSELLGTAVVGAGTMDHGFAQVFAELSATRANRDRKE